MKKSFSHEQRNLCAETSGDDPEHGQHHHEPANSQHEVRDGGARAYNAGVAHGPTSERRRAESASTSRIDTRKITMIDMAAP